MYFRRREVGMRARNEVRQGTSGQPEINRRDPAAHCGGTVRILMAAFPLRNGDRSRAPPVAL